MKEVKTFFLLITLLVLSETLKSQVKNIPVSFIGCWYSGMKINPKSKNQFDKFPSIYYELKNNSLNVVELDINGNETKRENSEFKVSNKSVFFGSNIMDIMKEGIVYELNFNNINNTYQSDNKYVTSAPLYKFTCPTKIVQEEEKNNNCPDGVLVSDKQISGTVKKYKETDGHYYYQVTLKVNLNELQKKHTKFLIFSTNKPANTTYYKKNIGETIIFKKVLENTNFFVTPNLNCYVFDNLRSVATIYFRDLKQIY